MRNQNKLNKSLFNAIANNNEKLVKDLIAKGADVNSAQKYNIYAVYTCLNKAISEGLIEIAEILINAGADVYAPSYIFNDKTGLSYLISAAACAKKNRLDAIKLIIRHSPDLLLEEASGALFMLSALNKKDDYKTQLDCCKELLKLNIDLNYVGTCEATALFRAAISGNIELTRLLIEHGADKNLASCFALDDYADIELISEKKKGLINHEAYVMYHAAFYNNINLLEKMVKYGFSLNTLVVDSLKSVYIPLKGAHNLSTRKWMFKNGATSSFIIDSVPNALCKAARGNETFSLKELLALGINPNQRWIDYPKATALHTAVSWFYLKVEKTQILLEAGADVHAVDLLKRSAMHYSVSEKAYEDIKLAIVDEEEILQIINLLVDKGISCNVVDVIGNTPLHIAAMNGHGPLILERLIELGNDINQKNHYGETALTLAAVNNRNIAVKYLLTKETKPDFASSVYLNKSSNILQKIENMDSADICDSEYNSLLHYAVKKGSLSIVKKLIEKGVNINAFNKFNKTALDTAHIENQKPIAEYLELKGARLYKDLLDNHLNPMYGYWIPKKDGEIIINYSLKGDLSNSYKINLSFYKAFELSDAQRKLFLQAFDYISSILKIKFIEVINKDEVDLVIGQSFDETVNLVEFENIGDYLSRAFITINKFDFNDSKIKYYPNCSFVRIIKYIGRVLGLSLSVNNSLEIGLPDEDYNKEFSENHLINLTSRYHFVGKYSENELKPKIEINYNSSESLELNTAIKNNDFHQVKKLIEKGVDVNKPIRLEEGDFAYPLSEAVMIKNEHIVKLLIDSGAKVNVIRNKSSTILIDACFVGARNIVNLLLKFGADPNLYADVNTDTIGIPLFVAIDKNHVDICKALIEAGADTNIALSWQWLGRNLVSMSAIYGNVDIVKLFYSENAELDLAAAFMLNKEDKISEIINKENIPKGKLEDLLQEAVDKNNLTLTEALLEFKVEASIGNLYTAVEDDKIELIEIIASKVKNINQYISQETVLHFAAKCKNEKIISILLRNGADPNIRNMDSQNILHLVMFNDNYINLNSIIKYGPEINAIDKNGNTPLHLAASTNYFSKYAEILTLSGANVNSINEDFKTVLHLAIENDWEGWIVDLFNNSKGDLNPQLKEPMYFSYIDFALNIANYKVIPALLAHGVKYNIISALKLGLRGKAQKMLLKNDGIFVLDSTRNTAIHVAAARGYLDLLVELVLKGIEVNALNRKNQTALDMAKEAYPYEENNPIIIYLTSMGAITGEEITGLNKLCKTRQQNESDESKVIDFFTRRVLQ